MTHLPNAKSVLTLWNLVKENNLGPPGLSSRRTGEAQYPMTPKLGLSDRISKQRSTTEMGFISCGMEHQAARLNPTLLVGMIYHIQFRMSDAW
jgi:hypothetical protein